MINSVSFRSNVPFTDMIKQPQKYATATETPPAAASIGGEKESSAGKKVVGTLIGLTAAATALVCLAKKGKFDFSGMKDGKIKNFLTREKVQNFIKGFQDKGSAIYDGVAQKANAAWDGIKGIFNKAAKEAPTEG